MDVKIQQAFIVILCLLITEIDSKAKTCNEYQQDCREHEDARILYFLDKTKGTLLVNIGSSQGVLPGGVYKTYRKHNYGKDTVKFNTGKIKVEYRDHNRAVAKVIENHPTIENMIFLPQTGVMSGDYIEAEKFIAKRRIQALPNLDVSYYDLFLEPNADTINYSLSSKGKEKLTNITNAFKGAKISHLFITGFTDDEGDEKQNQIESYQRALTVRNFLVQELGFDESRLVALGMGETSLRDTSKVGDHRRINRRIVISANTQSDR